MIINPQLKLEKGFFKRRKKCFEKAQNVIDTKCVEYMAEFTPVAKPKFIHAGKLLNSVAIKSPGKIIYTAPFARSDYYVEESVKNHHHGGNPKGERLWFEVMKVKYLSRIKKDVQKSGVLKK